MAPGQVNYFNLLFCPPTSHISYLTSQPALSALQVANQVAKNMAYPAFQQLVGKNNDYCFRPIKGVKAGYPVVE
jgi:hypothetical protein